MLRSMILALALAAGPSIADTVTVETYRGAVDTPKNPESWVVFDVAAADTLDALGLKPAGVINPIYVDYLGSFIEGAEEVGNLFEPDFEKLAAMKPDLIVAGGRSAEAVSDLEKIAPTLDMTIWEDTTGQALDRLEAYGEIFGKQAEAAALAEEFNTKLAAAKAAVSGQGKALMVMTNGPKVSAYGEAGRFGWLFKSLGLEEAVENVEEATHGEAISFEFINDANPDILIVLDRLAATGQDGPSAEVTLDNTLVHETNAWKNGNVIYLDGARFYIASGGIQSLMHTLDQFANAFSGS